MGNIEVIVVYITKYNISFTVLVSEMHMNEQIPLRVDVCLCNVCRSFLFNSCSVRLYGYYLSTT